ncbi:Holliday junction branch migration protein RuvA, partial [Patescibacteria group bacterium]|nr:Holliday junction branch migration protein RuvA [Patescibacteria group bacterium]
LGFKGENFAVVEIGGGAVGLKVFLTKKTLENLPKAGSLIKFFCFLHVKEDALDLYGFLSAEEKNFFELLISVSGVGPKSALAILGVDDFKNLSAAIGENRPDLFTQASGIGKKTAERIVLELRGKIKNLAAPETIKEMEIDADLIEALVSLGYRKEAAKSALSKIGKKITSPQERLKEALKILSAK